LSGGTTATTYELSNRYCPISQGQHQPVTPTQTPQAPLINETPLLDERDHDTAKTDESVGTDPEQNYSASMSHATVQRFDTRQTKRDEEYRQGELGEHQPQVKPSGDDKTREQSDGTQNL